MGIRNNFGKLINKKQDEIAALERQIGEAKAYIQSLQDSMKFLTRDGDEAAGYTLRPGTALAKARDAIKAAGEPLAIADILKAIGKPQDKKHRLSLAGTLSGYAKDGKIFTKTAPNTFGILEFSSANSEGEEQELPEEFGRMEK